MSERVCVSTNVIRKQRKLNAERCNAGKKERKEGRINNERKEKGNNDTLFFPLLSKLIYVVRSTPTLKLQVAAATARRLGANVTRLSSSSLSSSLSP